VQLKRPDKGTRLATDGVSSCACTVRVSPAWFLVVEIPTANKLIKATPQIVPVRIRLRLDFTIVVIIILLCFRLMPDDRGKVGLSQQRLLLGEAALPRAAAQP
jgi:hypothetical protein